MDILYSLSTFKKSSLFILVAFLGILLQSGSIQAQTVAVNTVRHETLPQNQIVVNYTGAGGATSVQFNGGSATLADWVVRINGTIVGTSSVTASTFNVVVTFDATALNGVNNILPGQTMTLNYSGGTGVGKLQVFVGASGSANYAPSITTQASLNNWVGSCADFTFFQVGDYSATDICSPVVNNFRQFQYFLSLRLRNSANFNFNSTMRFKIVWGDGTNGDYQPYYSDNTGAVNNAYYTTIPGYPASVITSRQNHTFPDNTNVCNFTSSIYPYINGVVFCASGSTLQTTTFISYDFDSENTGGLSLQPEIANSNMVCLGTNVGMRFSDNTKLNCVPDVPNIGAPNTLIRWARFVYGYQNAAAPGNIPNILVAGIPVTNGSGTVAPVGGYFPIGAGGPGVPGVPDGNGVIELSAPINTATAITYAKMITTSSPAGQAVGQRFYVRLDYWNTCNKYDGITTGNAKSIDNYIEIVDAPPAPVVAYTANHCDTDANGTFSISATRTQASSTLRWYRDVALTDLEKSSTTSATFNPVTEGSPALSKATTNSEQVISYYVTEQWGTGQNCLSPVTTITFRITDTNNGGVIDHPDEIGTTQVIAICTAADPPTFTNTTSASGGDGATYTYQWEQSTTSAIAGFGNAVGGTGATTTEYNPPALTQTTWYRRRVDSGYCGPAYSNVFQVRVDVAATGGTIGNPQTLCSGVTDPTAITSTAAGTGGSGTPTYSWQYSTDNFGVDINTIGGATGATYDPGPLTVTTWFRRGNTSGVCVPGFAFSNTIMMTVQQAIAPGAIATDQTICSGGDPAVLTSTTAASGGNGALTYSWESATNAAFTAGLVAPIVGASLATYDPPSGLTTTTFYRRRATGGVCTSQVSNTVVVTVNPLPAVTNVTGGGSVCSGNSAPQIQWTFTGAPPFNLTYTVRKNGGLFQTFPITNYTPPEGSAPYTFTIANPNPSDNTDPLDPAYDPAAAVGDVYAYQFTALTDNVSTIPSCNATTLMGARNVSIGGSAPIFDAGPTLSPNIVCVNGGSTTDPTLVFSLDDAGSASQSGFILTYRIDGTLKPTKSFNTNASGNPTAAITFSDAELNSAGAYTIRIVSIQSPAGCLSTFNTDLTFTVRALPSITTQPTAQSTCDLGNVTFISAATGTDLSFQWEEKIGAGAFAPISDVGVFSGTTTNTLVLTAAPVSMNARQYHVIVTGYNAPSTTPTCPVSSNAVTLTVRPYPTIDTPPPNRLICEGDNTTFTHASSVATAITGYQWQVSTNGGTLYTNLTNVAPYSDVTLATLVITNATTALNTNLYRVRVTATGGCTTDSAPGLLTVNPLPTANALTPIVCADLTYVPGSAGVSGTSATAVDLTDYDVAVADAPGAPVEIPLNTVVRYYPTSLDRSNGTNQILTDRNITPATLTVFARVVNTMTTCFKDANLVFTIRPLPQANNHTVQVCENAPPGSGKATLNLTNYNAAVTDLPGGGVVQPANRTIEWYTNANFLPANRIPIGTASGAEENFDITATTTLFAKIIDTTVGTPGCPNIAELKVQYQARPNDNQIRDGSNAPTGVTYTVCASNSLVLLQIDPSINPGSSYTWTVPAPAYVGEFELLTATNGFFIILRFPNPITSPGIPISVKETLGAALCDGNTFTTNVVVEGSPPKPVISGTSTVCANDNGVIFSVPAVGGSSYSWSLPPGATITSFPVTLASITVQMGTFSGNVTVVQSSGNGCTSPAADPFPVAVVSRPSMTSAISNTLCSGQTVSAVHTLTASIVGSTFNWEVVNVTGFVSGAILGNTGNGQISQTLTNTSGVSASVTYRVTPVGPNTGASPVVNCQGTPQNVTITITPEAVITPSQSKSVCSGQPANYKILLTPASLPGATKFAWPAPVMPAGLTGGTANPTAGGELQSNATHITDVLVNATNAPLSAIYTVTPMNGTCPGAAVDVEIVVNPTPAIPAQVATICSGATFTITPVDSDPTAATIVPANTKYTWTAPVVLPTAGSLTGAIAEPIAQASISQALTNTTNVVQTATYTVTPISGAAGSCVGPTFTVTVTVDPRPEIPAQNTTICSGGTFTIAPVNGTPSGATIVPGSTTYTWTAPSVAPTAGSLVGAAAEATPQNSISALLTNTTNIVQTATYTVTPTSGAAGSCPGAPFTVTVTVNPKPEIPTQTATICSGGTFTVTPSNGNPTAATIVPAGTTYTWTAPTITPTAGSLTGASAQPASQASISQTLTNTTNSVQTATYTVTPTSGASGSCGGASFTVTVTVDPKPVIPTQTATICSGGTFTVTPADGNPSAATIVPTATTYTWSAPIVAPTAGSLTGAVAQPTGQPSISQTLTNTTSVVQTATYTVTPTSGDAGNCIGAPFTVTVTVDPRPEIPTQSATICSGGTFSITPVNGTPTAATIVPSGTTYTWATPSVSPTAGSLTGAIAEAAPQTSISQMLTNTTNVVQTATYTVTPLSGASGGCAGAIFTVTVTVDPKPEIPAQTATICSGGTFSVIPVNGNPTAATIVPTGTTYTWTAPVVAPTAGSLTGVSAQPSGQVAISQTLTNTTNVAQTATYTVTPTSGAAGSCVGSSFTVTVTVDPKPVVPTQSVTICSSDTFTITPVNGTPSAATIIPLNTTYTWTAPVITPTAGSLTGAVAEAVPQTSISQALTNTTNIVQTATYTVTPTSGDTGSCVGATFTVTVTVNPKPEIPTQTATICSGGTFSITPVNGNPTLATIVPAATTYTWTAPVVAPTAGSLTGVSNQAVGQFTISQTLTNTTNIVQTATYTVTPMSGASGSCVGTPFTITVTVDPKPVIAAQIATICSGDTFTVTPANATPTSATIVPANTTYTWTAPTVAPTAGSLMGAGAESTPQTSISQALTNTSNITQTATYTVTPTSGDAGNCVGATFTVTVTVNPKPEIPDQAATICSGATFTIAPVNGSPTAATIVPAGTKYTWLAPVITPTAGSLTGAVAQPVGQTSISQALTNTTNVVQTAVYIVTPTSGASGTCVGATFTVTITVDPKPVIPTQIATICSGGTFTITPADGNPSAAIIVPTGTTYTWTLPTVSPTAGSLTGAVAQASAQTSISQTLINTTNVVQTATYTVTPTSGDAGNCVGTPFTVTITVDPKPEIPAQAATICSGGTFTITPANSNPTLATIVPGGTTYTWTAPTIVPTAGSLTGAIAQPAGQPSISQTLTNTTNVVQTATYTVTPTSGDAGNCVGATFTVTITVNPKPVIPTQTATICSGGTFSIMPIDGTPTAATIVPSNTTYTWTAPTIAPTAGSLTGAVAQPVGQTSISQTLTNKTNVVQTATYTVTPTSGDAGSCVGAAFTVTVIVDPKPEIPAQTATICSGAAFSITPANATPTAATIVPANTTYIWSLPAVTGGITGAIAEATPQTSISQVLTNPTNVPQTATYTVTPTSGDAGTCLGADFTITVTVNPTPVIPTQTAMVCSDEPFTVTPANSGPTIVPAGTTYTWPAPTLPGGLTGGSAQATPQTSISQTLTNLGASAQVATYTVTPVSGAAGACPGASFQVQITVNPEPVAQALSNIERCSSQPINFDMQDIINNVAPFTGGNSVTSKFKYTVVADFALDVVPSVFPGVFDRTVASVAPISETFSNYSNHDVTLTYTVTPYSTAFSCEGTPFVLKVVYHPEPVGSNLTEPNCNTALDHDIQATQITNGLASVFTYTISQSPAGALALPADRTVASDAKITDAYVNLTGSPVEITYTITAYNKLLPACVASGTFTYKVTISPKPVGITDVKPAVCSDEVFVLDPQGNISPAVASTFTWDATYDGVAIPSGTGVITTSFNNTSNVVKNAVYTITPTAQGSGCAGLPFTITVPISPEPVMNPALANPGAICSTNSVSTNITNIILNTNGTSVDADAYKVEVLVGDQEAGLVGTPTTGTFAAVGGVSNAITNDTYRNTTSAQLRVVYTVTPIVGTCLGDPMRITLKVNPEPVLDDPGYPAVCSTNATNTNPINVILGTNGTSANAVSYVIQQIQYSNGGPFSTTPPTGVTRTAVPGSGISLIRNDRFNNISGVPVTVKYTIQGTSAALAGGCVSEPYDFTIVIDPEPTFTPNTIISCSGIATGLVLTEAVGSSAITSYELITILPAPGSTGVSAAATNVVPGVYPADDFLKDDVFFNITEVNQTMRYTVVPISGLTCKGTRQIIDVTINPAPAMVGGLDKKVCSGAVSGIVFADNSSGNPAAIPPYSTAATSYELMSVTVDPALNVGSVSSPGIVSVNAIANDKFDNLTNDPHNVVYKVVPISIAGCRGPETIITLTVEPKIVAAPVNNAPTVCSGSPVNIVLNSPSNPTPNPNALPDPLITFNYSMVSMAGISGSTSATNVAQGFVISDQLVNNTNAALTVNYKVTAVAASAAGGTGCSSAIADVFVVVEPKPKLQPTRPTQTVCEGTGIAGVTLNSPTTPSAGNGTVVFDLISVIDVNTAAAPATVTGFSAVGTVFNVGQALNDVLSNTTSEPQVLRYTFRPHFSAGLACVGADVDIDITVNPLPVVTATPVTPLTICSSESIEVSLSTDTDPSTTIVRWTALASSVDVVGESGGAGETMFQTLLNKSSIIQTVDYTITPSFSGCSGTPIHIVVTVNPIPVVTVPSKMTVCGGVPFTLNLLPLVTTDPSQTTFKWEVTDVNGIGTAGEFDGTGTSINQVFTNNTDASATMLYQITPIGPGGCEGQPKIINLSVAPVITASFVSVDEGVCEGTPVFLTFELHGQPPFDFTYNEITTAGTTLKAVTKSGNIRVQKVTPTVTTTYEIVSAKDALGCEVTFAPKPTVTITVYKAVTANWTANIPPFIGGNSTVTFTNTSTVLDPAQFRYEWTFGSDASPTPGSSTSVGPTINVSYNRPGDHYIALRVVNLAAEAAGQDCESTFAAKINIPILPLMADFKFEPAVACFPQNIIVTENTATGNTMLWKVYDSNGRLATSSGDALPQFLITTPGEYTINLQTSDSFTGETAFSPTKTFTVYGNPVASFQARPSILFVPDTELITANFTTGATDYAWEFGDGETSDERAPTHFYKIEGIYDIMLIAKNDHGGGVVCQDTLVQKVTAKQGGVTKVPNAFTPNTEGPNGGHVINGSGDMNNDVFLPYVKGVEEFNMQIYDRWGNMIFESNDANTGWDGYEKHGKLMQSGVYVYKLTLRLSDGQRTTQMGDITLIR